MRLNGGMEIQKISTSQTVLGLSKECEILAVTICLLIMLNMGRQTVAASHSFNKVLGTICHLL